VTAGEQLPPVAPGDLVAGKYRVDRVLGAGGMGVVVAATHEQLDQRVALKFLLAAVAVNADIVHRFLREARAAVKIQSEHVARVLDVGTLETGVPYMVMEFLDGEDLSQVVEARGSLPVQEAVGYVLEAIEAVAEAHSLGIVHRDLKPANLFLARRPTGKPIVKVLDFGISKVSSNVRNDVVTKTSSLMGSPGYMSPEQMVDAKSVDVRADVWSFGIVLYEMLSGCRPFAGDTMPELIAAILQKEPAPLGSLRADVPVGLLNVVHRCLHKQPAGRYSNVAELARALAPFGPPRAEQSLERIEHVLGLTTGPAPMPIATAADGLVRSDPATLQPTTTVATRQRWGFFVLPGLLLVAGLGVALFFGLRSPKGSSAASSGSAAQISASPPAPSVSSDPSPAAALAAPSSALAPPSAFSASATSAAPTAPPAPSVRRGAPAISPKSEPRPSISSPPAASSAPACRVVSYFDADGAKHFKQECP
jgi:serine/threonine-protein kinase